MPTAVIVDAVRSPVGRGKAGGALSGLHAVELLREVFAGLMGRVDVDPALIEDIIVGCVSQAADQSANPGRWAWLGAGLPEHVPACTVDRRCGSSQQALHFAAQGIMAGSYDAVVVGGLESMSRVPMGSARMGVDPFGPSSQQRYAPGIVPQGVSAELVAAKWSLSRLEQDEFAARSQQRAHDAAVNGLFADEIVGIDVGDGAERVLTDQTIRPGTTVEGLAGLKPAFESEEMSARFPQIDWSVTAGNSSQLADGASAVLVVEEQWARERGLSILARVLSMSVVGDDPVMMLTGPIPASERVLKRSGLQVSDIGHFEVNEAFASVPLAYQRHFSIADEQLNPRGGAIALGHPLGASGARLLTTMLHSMRSTGTRYGLQTMCEAGGLANATILELVG